MHKFGRNKTLPRRVCRDPHTKYCKAPNMHRGCCECLVCNEEGLLDMECNPYLLPEELEKLKLWWLASDMGPWDEAGER